MTETTHAGPSFSTGPSSETQQTIQPLSTTLPPRPTTAPPRPPSQLDHLKPNGANTPFSGTAATSLSTPIEAQLLDTNPPTQAKQPVNQTKYRQSLFARAKESATKFLGKFFFGNHTLTEVLPPVQQEKPSIRDANFQIDTGKIYWKDCYHM